MISKHGVTVLNAAYSLQWSIIFSIIPEHSDASVLSWHEFKNSFAVASWLRTCNHSSSHFHSLILVEFVTSQGLLGCSKQ